MVAINADNEPTDVEGLRRHGIETVLMPGVGHFLFLEDPPRFNLLLRDAIRRLATS